MRFLDLQSIASILGWLPVQSLLRDAAVSKVWRAAGFDLKAWEGFRLNVGFRLKSGLNQSSENNMRNLPGDGLFHVAARLRDVAQVAWNRDCSDNDRSCNYSTDMQVLPRRPTSAQDHIASPLEVCRYCFGSVEFWFLQFNTTVFGYLSDMDTMGLKVWLACLVFCQYLSCDVDAPNVVGKQCLELGAGAGVLSAVLCSLGASVLTTDQDATCLAVASVNMRLNGINFFHTEELCYGLEGANRLRRTLGNVHFDFIFASDVVYSESVCMPLFDTVGQLLSSSGSFYLAYELRDEAHQSSILQAARSANFSWDEPYAPAEPKSPGISGTLEAMRVLRASGASLSTSFKAVYKTQRVLVYRFYPRQAINLHELD